MRQAEQCAVLCEWSSKVRSGRVIDFPQWVSFLPESEAQSFGADVGVGPSCESHADDWKRHPVEDVLDGDISDTEEPI
jgi:hypothetical protein